MNKSIFSTYFPTENGWKQSHSTLGCSDLECHLSTPIDVKSDAIHYCCLLNETRTGYPRPVLVQGYCMATLKMFAVAIRHNDIAVSLNLSDIYFHVNVVPSHRQFFCFKIQGKNLPV